MRSERAAVEWVLTTRGYIAADGSILDQMARRVWEQWWREREPRQLDAGELAQRAFALDDAARPAVFGGPADMLEEHEYVPGGRVGPAAGPGTGHGLPGTVVHRAEGQPCGPLDQPRGGERRDGHRRDASVGGTVTSASGPLSMPTRS